MVGMELKDVKNESDWLTWSGEDWREDIQSKTTSVRNAKRVRLMSRGEAFSTEADIDRVTSILKANPKSIFWVPTRAWHDATLKRLIESKVERFPNVRVMYSTDPSDIPDEYKKTINHSTMFYGDDTLDYDPLGRKFFKCPKTWQNKKGYCAVCKHGCFSTKEVHVHMKQH
jgi:hypothetical protein